MQFLVMMAGFFIASSNILHLRQDSIHAVICRLYKTDWSLVKTGKKLVGPVSIFWTSKSVKIIFPDLWTCVIRLTNRGLNLPA